MHTQIISNKAPQPRSGHCCCLSDNNFYVFGGLSDTQLLDDFYVINLEEKIWRKITSPGPPGRTSAQMAGQSKIIYLFRGTSQNVEKVLKNDLWMYNDQWSIVAQGGPCERYGHSLIYNNNQLFLFGGVQFTNKQFSFLNDLWSFSIIDKQWKRLELTGTAPQPRFRHSTLFVEDKLYIIGGSTNQNRFGQIYVADLDKLQYESIELESKKFKTKGNLFKGRFGHANILVDGSIYIFGGLEDNLCNNVIMMDVQNHKWSKKQELPFSPRDFFGYSFEDNKLVIFGGNNNGRMYDLHLIEFPKSLKQLCTLKEDIYQLLKEDQNQSNLNVQDHHAHRQIIELRCPRLLEIQLSPQHLEIILQYAYRGEIDQSLIQNIQFTELISLGLNMNDTQLIQLFLVQHLTQQKTTNDYAYIIGELIKLQSLHNNNYLKDVIAYLQQRQTIKDNKDNKQQIQQFKKHKFLFYDNREFIQNKFYDHMKYLRYNFTTTDTIITSGDQQYKVHSFVLLARSEYFRMITQFGNNKQINIDPFEPQIINALLDYLYFGYQSLSKLQQSYETLLDLYKVSSYFLLTNQNYLQLIQEGIAKHITIQNVLDMVKAAEILNAPHLLRSCCQFIAQNLKQIELQDLSRDTLLCVLQIMKQ